MRTWTGYIRRHRDLALALALGLLLLWGWQACSSDGGDVASAGRKGMGMAAPPVRVATALAQDVPHFLNGLGTVVPSVDVLVKSRVDGQLLRLHFQEGQRVVEAKE